MPIFECNVTRRCMIDTATVEGAEKIMHDFMGFGSNREGASKDGHFILKVFPGEVGPLREIRLENEATYADREEGDDGTERDQ